MSATINAANFLMLSVFGIAAVGYLLGRITIKGISLGTAGVFVIALIYGAFSGTHFNSKFVIEEINYASQALKIIENLGLVFFVTSVGFIAGPELLQEHEAQLQVLCAARRRDHSFPAALRQFCVCSLAVRLKPGSRATTRTSLRL